MRRYMKMSKVTVGQYELTKKQVQLLLSQLKTERVRNSEDLQRYLKNYEYMDDPSRRCHLLISPTDKKESFAIPYDET